MKKLFSIALIFISIFTFSQDLELDKDSITIENGFKAHFEEGNFEKAEYIYNRLLESDDKNPDYYFRRGRLYFSWKKYKLAISDFNKAIKLDYPELANAYSMVGMSKMLMHNDPNKLCKDFKKAIKYDKELSKNEMYMLFCN